MQNIIQNFRAASRIFKKGHFWGSFTHKYIKITLFWEERALLCQILLGTASNYWTLISFGLFLEMLGKIHMWGMKIWGRGSRLGEELFLVWDEQILATLWRLALSPTNKENLSIRGLTVYLTAETTAATTTQNNFLDQSSLQKGS